MRAVSSVSSLRSALPGRGGLDAPVDAFDARQGLAQFLLQGGDERAAALDPGRQPGLELAHAGGHGTQLLVGLGRPAVEGLDLDGLDLGRPQAQVAVGHETADREQAGQQQGEKTDPLPQLVDAPLELFVVKGDVGFLVADVETESILVCHVYSHSIVLGGLELMSYTTRLTPVTSLMMRLDTRARNSCGRRAQSAVMASRLVTARMAAMFS